MGMDRNTVIGFVLLGILLFLYLFISTKNSQEYEKQKRRYDDSIAMVKVHQNAIAKQQDTAKKNQATSIDTSGYNKAISGTEQLLTVENDLIRIVFTNKGGQPKKVELKKFNAFDSTPVKVINPVSENHVSYSINTEKNQSAQITDLFFSEGRLTKNADGTQTVDFRLPSPGGESIVHHYTIRPNDYMIDWEVQVENPAKLFTGNNMNLAWHYEPVRVQQSVVYEKRQANISYYEDNNFDYISRKTEAVFEKPVQWISVSQQFFNTTFLAKNGFNSGNVKWAREISDTSNLVAKADVAFQYKVPAGNSASIPFQFYYGPTIIIY